MPTLVEITHECRICGSAELKEIIDFGDLALTGVFLENGQEVPKAPLKLVLCNECGLVQLGHKYEQNALYGETYGYESHLNRSMVEHLQQKARVLEKKFLQSIEKPIVVDIASNDGTLLNGYISDAVIKIGIDPLIGVVANCYPEDAIQVSEFFSASAYMSLGIGPANLVTSLSVIYDLDRPVEFANQIYEILQDEGIWHFEQSYLPLMLETNSYDTICHEHLLYLSLTDIQRILKVANFQLLDASINSVNGGSIAVTAIKTNGVINPSPFVRYLLKAENETGITDGSRINSFSDKFRKHANALKSLITEYKELGFDVIGLGASTKGNVLLQAAGIDARLIRAIGEVNPRKFGKQTPGSSIPIVDESNLLSGATEKTLAIVLPWHFRENLLPKLEQYLSQGGQVLFPLPEIEMVSS
jgi:hypothetical protein